MRACPRQHADGSAAPLIECLESRRLLHGDFELHVQFAPAKVTPTEGYALDSGLPFGEREGGLIYGWSAKRVAKGVARSAKLEAPDGRFRSFVSFKTGATWQAAVPNGTYEVRLVSGDAKVTKRACELHVEGANVLSGKTSRGQRWLDVTATIAVNDGMLEISSPRQYRGGRLNFVDVTRVHDDALPEAPPGQPPPPAPDPNSAPTTVGDWTAGAPSPIERAEAIGAEVDGKLYVFGGLRPPGTGFSFRATQRSDVYDPATNTWTQLRDMPEAFTHSPAVVEGSTIWFVGGFRGDSPGPGMPRVYKYDTPTDTWSRGPNLPSPRGSGAAQLVGRTLHYFGGADRNRVDRAEHWALDLDNQDAGWMPRASLPTMRNHMSSAVVDGKIYAVGGQVGDLAEAVDVATVERYDPATDAWSTVAALPGPRSHTSTATLVLNGKILVLGGESPEFHQEIYQYDPLSDRWSLFGLLPDARSTTVAGIVGGQMLVATGNAPGATNDVWIGKLS